MKRSRRQRELDERARLEKERNRLRSELALKEKVVSQAESKVDVVRSDAAAELRRVNLALQDTAADYEQIREQATHELFQDLIASPAQISLIKLLTLEDDTELRWLLPLAYYLRERVGLHLIGEKNQRLTLTVANCDDYIIHEAVSLPCEVRISRRGFSIGETVIARPEVTSLLEE